MLPLLVSIAIVVVVIACAAVMTACVAAISLLSPGRIRRLVEAERNGAVALDALADTSHRLRAAAAFAAATAYVTTAAVAAHTLFVQSAADEFSSAVLGAVVAAVFVFAFGTALPRTIGVQNPEGVALASSRITRRLTTIFYAPAKVLAWPWIALVRLVAGERAVTNPWVTDDDYRSGNDDEESDREEAEEALLEAVSDFTEKIVREVMVPRTDMSCISDAATADEAIALIEGKGYSRLPVYHETLDDIRGVLYAKDLLAAISRDRDVSPAAIARRPYFVPETKPLQELLIEMRAKTHLAIVADEYGGTAGLVTIEDLLEEIVGEIFDEYDLEIPLVTELGEGRYLVDARLPVDDLNELFGTAIDSDTDTVGGVVIEVAGRIPVEGDTVEIEGLRLIVEDLQGTRIKQLVVEPAAQHDTKEGLDA